jgi:hypothetical protein
MFRTGDTSTARLGAEEQDAKHNKIQGKIMNM